MDALDAIEDIVIKNDRFYSINSYPYFKNDGIFVYHMNIRSLKANFD